MRNSPWYSGSYRRNLVDMHIEEWDDSFLAEFSPETYFENLRRGEIQSPMLYIQSHTGLCYWPCREGRMHRAFRGREAAMRELFNLCHGAGMDVVAYYSLIFNSWAYDNNPEWRMRTADGRDVCLDGGRKGICCPNSEGYRAFVLAQIDDFCSYFDFEGVFLDMTFWPVVCCCPSCRARWEREVGGELPTTVDWSDPRWILFQQKRQEWLGEFAHLTTDRVKSHKPGCSVEHQNSTDIASWLCGVNSPVIDACDYVGGDLYGGVAQQSFACKLYYSLTKSQPFEYMTSRCYPNLLEHTTTKTPDMLRQSVLLTCAHHGASLLIDAIDPRGTMDSRVYDLIGDVFREERDYEPWLEGRPVADVGIYYSMNGNFNPEETGPAALLDRRMFAPLPHLDAALGAAAALRSRHIPFWVIGRANDELMDRLRVLVLPDAPGLTPEELNAVRRFLKRGGKLYFSRYAAPELVGEIFGLHSEGLTEETVTYLAPTEDGKELLAPFTEDYPLAVMTGQARLAGSPLPGVRTLATMTLPYTKPSEARYASIHSNPPGIRTSLPALLQAEYGSGTAVWSAAPLEAAQRPQHEDIFADIIRSLAGAPAFSTDAPDYVEVILFEVPQKRRLLMSMTDTQDRFRLYRTGPFSLRIPRHTPLVRVAAVPSGQALPFTCDGEDLVIPIDGLQLFQMIAIDF